MLWLGEQYVYFNDKKFEDKGKFSKGVIKRSKKNQDGTYSPSSFFCQFIGEAHKKISINPDIKSFKLMKGAIDNSPYKNADGETRWPKSPTVIIFDVDEIKYNDNVPDFYGNDSGDSLF